MPVLVTASIPIGATGAVGAFVGSMVQGVVRNSAGNYTITLQPNTNFSRLYSAQGSLQSPPSGLSGILCVEIQNAPNTSIAAFSSTAGGSITVNCLDAAGAAADPASGSTLNIQMICSNSSVTVDGE